MLLRGLSGSSAFERPGHDAHLASRVRAHDAGSSGYCRPPERRGELGRVRKMDAIPVHSGW
jgi:hypothetical protein